MLFREEKVQISFRNSQLQRMFINIGNGGPWGHTPVIQTLRRMRQEDHKFKVSLFQKQNDKGLRKMAQCLRVLVVLAEDTYSSVPSTCMAAYNPPVTNSSLKWSETLIWLPWAPPYTCTFVHARAHTHTVHHHIPYMYAYTYTYIKHNIIYLYTDAYTCIHYVYHYILTQEYISIKDTKRASEIGQWIKSLCY